MGGGGGALMWYFTVGEVLATLLTGCKISPLSVLSFQLSVSQDFRQNVSMRLHQEPPVALFLDPFCVTFDKEMM